MTGDSYNVNREENDMHQPTLYVVIRLKMKVLCLVVTTETLHLLSLFASGVSLEV